MTKVALIGAGPCGLSFLRAIEQAEKKGEKVPEVVCLKSKKIGEVCGITVGEQVQINMVIQFLIVCIDIYGLMAQKNV